MAVTNIHGRKPGRGIRPWLLLPKVLCVGVYFGGVVAATFLWITADRTAPPLAALNQVSRLFLYVNVPALLAAIVLGILLFFQHPRQFIRLRWFQVKLVTLVLTIPAGHLFTSSRVRMLRQAFEQGQSDADNAGQLTACLLVMVVLTAWVILLGRLKPRLGQNWARAYPDSSR